MSNHPKCHNSTSSPFWISCRPPVWSSPLFPTQDPPGWNYFSGILYHLNDISKWIQLLLRILFVCNGRAGNRIFFKPNLSNLNEGLGCQKLLNILNTYEPYQLCLERIEMNQHNILNTYKPYQPCSERIKIDQYNIQNTYKPYQPCSERIKIDQHQPKTFKIN